MVTHTRNAAMALGQDFNAVRFAGSIISELGSPTGCAFIIFIGQMVSHNFSIYKAHQQSSPPSTPR